MTSLPWLDFDLARNVGQRLMPAGPPTTAEQRRDAVDDLRRAARVAPALISQASGLPLVTDGLDLVIDRRSWVASMVSTAEAMWQRLGSPASPNLGQRITGRAMASQLGGLLAVLGTRILGQFDPFSPTPRLLLVAPNVVQVERQLALVPRDFRTWVALHEQTHRVQFAAAPWLPDHLLGLVRRVLAAEDDAGEGILDVLLRLVRPGGGRAKDGADQLSGEPARSHGAMLDVLSAPQAGEPLDEVNAVMSLLEGHADVLMDLAGPEVIETLPVIRKRFEARRDGGGRFAAIGKLVGMDAKLAQYRDGAVFSRAVLDVAGHQGLNRVFESPQHLPSRDELLEPALWMRRVLGLGGRPA
ncbi:zinc-dependent metalloprotease [Propionibacteriaceae bacterium Y1923]|uniref:zinc-dependent metalloprotease n=1 Tax=Aestuariimicrobium sp. Y1814 TaxID=3418742 RepID=UPI003C1A3EB7